MGYRFDDTLVWVETGGIYIHSDVPNAEIFLDGEFVDKNGVLIRNTLIQNLRPDDWYTVEIHKENYHSWIKELFVKPSLVTEARILMLPVEIEKEAFYPYEDDNGNGTTTALIDDEEEEVEKNSDYLDFEIIFGLATSTNENSDAIEIIQDGMGAIATTTTNDFDLEEIPEYFIQLGVRDPNVLENLITKNDEVSWLEDGQIVLHWIGKIGSIPYYYCQKEECRTSIRLDDWEDEIIKFDYLVGRDDVWIVLTNSGLWAVEVDDRSNRNIQPIYLGDDLDFAVDDRNRLIVLDNEVFYLLKI